MKIALFITFICIHWMPSHCMQQNAIIAKQIPTLFTIIKQIPDLFNPLAQSIAHTLYQRNPNLSRNELVKFFRARGFNRAAVYPWNI